MVRIEEADLENALNISLLRDDMDQIWHIMNSDEKSVHNAMDPTLIQREKERAIRSQLNSAHGDTAEIHDQFYRDHKLLITLFQTLAVMPITRSSPGKKNFHTAWIYYRIGNDELKITNLILAMDVVWRSINI